MLDSITDPTKGQIYETQKHYEHVGTETKTINGHTYHVDTYKKELSLIARIGYFVKALFIVFVESLMSIFNYDAYKEKISHHWDMAMLGVAKRTLYIPIGL